MSFVLTAQFVLVNVVIAVLMKHLEESNAEAKDEAELEAELELEALALAASAAAAQAGGAGLIGGHSSSFMQEDTSGPASPRTPPPPWIFNRDPQENCSLANDSPPPTMVDIRRDSTAHIRVDSPHCMEPPIEVSGRNPIT